jgi:predicted phage tail component-like protein
MTDFTFNGTSAASLGFTLTNIKKPILPPQKEITIDIPKYPGFISSSKKFTHNRIEVEGLLIGSGPTDLVTKLKAFAAFLYYDTDKQLIFDDESDRYYLAQHIDTVVTSRKYRFCELSLIFNCNDPFAYATSADTDNQEITVSGTQYAITNSGHYIAYPTILFFFNQVQSHIYIDNTSITDNRMDISKSFAMSDELLVDCKNLTIKLNNVNSPAGLGLGGSELAEFLMLDAGSNTIEVGTDDASLDVDVTISFNKAYFF